MNQSLFKTSDQGLAAFLMSRDFTFLGAVKTTQQSASGQPRCDFCFLDRKDRTELSEAYYTMNPDFTVIPKRYRGKLTLLGQALRNPVDPAEIEAEANA